MLPSSSHNPDVLACLANLSSDEVFTPPQLVNEILDLIPAEIWADRNARFLDPACKSGVFLREMAKRLDDGLESAIPDRQARLNHIFKNQLFGLAITELTSLLSRRSLYCSKTANGAYSVCDGFDDPAGNVRFGRVDHTWEKGRCIHCGASRGEYARGEELETHAYEFIHLVGPEEVSKMRFDVIVGNPPYQLDTGGTGRQATPIYHHFVQQAKKLNPRFIAMIIPSRWFAGGMGLDKFRQEMLGDKRLSHLVDFPIASDVFPGVKIIGGVCYFLWERDHTGPCLVETHMSGEEDAMLRDLNEFSTFVRFNKAVPIIKKVLAKQYPSMSALVSGVQPFGMPTNVRPTGTGRITLYANKTVGKIDVVAVTSGKDMVYSWKVLLGMAYGEGGETREYPRMIIGRPIVAAPPSACTMTYLVAGAFKTKAEADNLAAYLQTKFLRFLVAMKKNTQHITRDRFEFVPALPMTERWTDERLYALFALSADEIAFIESLIRPTEAVDE